MFKELERYIENLKKNHRHELGIERARSKETQHQLENAQAFNKKLEEQVKVNLLDNFNIFDINFRNEF